MGNRTRNFTDAVRDGEVPGLSIDPDNPAMAYDPMGLETPPGSKVRFTGHGGWPRDKEHAHKHLTVGNYYTVKWVEVGNWSSAVEFKELPGVGFNTVMFERAREEAKAS